MVAASPGSFPGALFCKLCKIRGAEKIKKPLNNCLQTCAKGYDERGERTPPNLNHIRK